MARLLLNLVIIVLSFYSPHLKALQVENLDSVKITLSSEASLNNSFKIPPESKLCISFQLKNTLEVVKNYIIKFDRVETARLYTKSNSKDILIAQSGSRLAIKDRSIIDDISAIQFSLQSQEYAENILVFDNLSKVEKKLNIQLLDNEAYMNLRKIKDSSFHEKYWKNIFFGILILALILSIFQYLILPEKALIYYFLYVFFTMLRAISANETLILEDFFSILRSIGYHSLYSQIFTYTAFIFYILFVREFTGFATKKPNLDWGFKLHIGFLMCFIVFDLIFPTEKYNNITVNHVFRSLETFGLLIGLYTSFLLTKVYDRFNKYIIFGAFSLLVIAIFGQEIIKRTVDSSQNTENYLILLSILWSVAYTVEIVFFTIALINRQRIILKTISIEKTQNTIVNNKTIEEEINNLPPLAIPNDSFTLATNRGVLVFQQSDIVRLEASGNYTIFSIQNQKQTLGSYTLSDFESKLNPSKFLRVHKSHVVNLHFVVKYTKGDGGFLTLQDGSVIPVSRSRKDELIKRLNFF